MKKVLAILLVGTLLIFSCAREAVEEEVVEPVQVAPEEEAIEEEELEMEEEMVEEEKIEEVTEEELEEVLEVVVEEDTLDIFYMVRPGDYLIKIAKNEYGVASMWRAIYNWNRAEIGDNPDLIYPFHEFLLKKPREVAEPLEYDFYEYVVQENESLWSIAGKEYENNYAWIVILRDNAETLGSDLRNIPVGTILKIRTNLF